MSASMTNDLSITRPRSGMLTRPSVLDVLAFAAPLFRFVHIEVVGTLYLTEVLLATALLLQFFRSGRRLAIKPPRTFILLLLSWLFAQVVTDIIRGSAFNDYARGWAMIGFALINFSALYLLLVNSPKRIVLFALGLAAGQIIEYIVAPGVYAQDYPWKFGYGIGVNWLLVLLAVGLAKGRLFGRLWPSAVLLLVAALNIFMGFRSAGGVAFLTACYLAAQALRGTRSAATRLRPRQLFILGAVAVLGAGGALQLYKYSVEAGWLGEKAQQKYAMQAFGEYGVLLGGRSEILVSSLAVLESPVIGHGSWAKDCRYTSLYIEIKREAGYIPGEEDEQCLIPTHSHLMGAWVQAGIVGAVVWLWVLWMVARALLKLYVTPNRLAPLIVFSAFSLVWDILFSPFAGFTRFVTPFYVVVVMVGLSNMNNRRPRPRLYVPIADQANPREAS